MAALEVNPGAAFSEQEHRKLSNDQVITIFLKRLFQKPFTSLWAIIGAPCCNINCGNL
jgi:hypothetical protein